MNHHHNSSSFCSVIAALCLVAGALTVSYRLSNNRATSAAALPALQLPLRRIETLPLQLCSTHSEHVRGTWRTGTAAAAAATAACCHPNVTNLGAQAVAWSRARPYCTSATSITVLVSAAESAAMPHYINAVGHGCSCASSAARIAAGMGERARAEWHPSQCLLPSWDARAFCAALNVRVDGQSTSTRTSTSLPSRRRRSRILLLVGDSTMKQTFTVLRSMLVRAEQHECARAVRFGNSDTLIGKSLGFWNRGKKWDVHARRIIAEEEEAAAAAVAVAAVATNNNNNNNNKKRLNSTAGSLPELIVVLTAGAHIRAHIHSDENGKNETMIEANFFHLLDEVSRMSKTLLAEQAAKGADGVPVRLLWKTQNPPGCTKTISQSKNSKSLTTTTTTTTTDTSWRFNYEAVTGRTWSAQEIQYSWHRFPQRDAWAVDLFGASGSSFDALLDMRPLYLRGDAHVERFGVDGNTHGGNQDCLHFCTGESDPLRLIGRLLQNYLRLLPTR